MWAQTRCNVIDYHNTTGTVLPPEFDPSALQHAIAGGINSIPRGAETQSPYELEFDRKPRYDHLMQIGQPVVIQVLPKPADKSIPPGTQGHHVGMTEGSDSLHLVLLTYMTKGGKTVTRVVRSRTAAPIFDGMQSRGVRADVLQIMARAECEDM
jgi:hypothetical protein